MLHPGHCPLQFGAFIPVIVAIVQFAFDRVDFLLLIGEGFTSMVNEDRSTVTVLPLGYLAIKIEPALLQLVGSPFSEGRIGG